MGAAAASAEHSTPKACGAMEAQTEERAVVRRARAGGQTRAPAPSPGSPEARRARAPEQPLLLQERSGIQLRGRSGMRSLKEGRESQGPVPGELGSPWGVGVPVGSGSSWEGGTPWACGIPVGTYPDSNAAHPPGVRSHYRPWPPPP